MRQPIDRCKYIICRMFHVMTGAHYPYPASLCHNSDEAARFALNMLYSSHKEVNEDQCENMFYSIVAP